MVIVAEGWQRPDEASHFSKSKVIPSHVRKPLYVALGYEAIGEIHIPNDGSRWFLPKSYRLQGKGVIDSMKTPIWCQIDVSSRHLCSRITSRRASRNICLIECEIFHFFKSICINFEQLFFKYPLDWRTNVAFQFSSAGLVTRLTSC